jgi:hypothetical protein
MALKQLYKRFSDGSTVAKDLNYTKITGFQYPFQNQSNFIIMHNQGTTNILLQCFINNYLAVTDYTIIDSNNIEIILSEAASGFVNIIFFG